MKEIYFILFAMICTSYIVKSQDTITLKNGLVIYGLITEVSNGQIKFRIDGGAIDMSEVKSYNKSGNAVSVNNSSSQSRNQQNAAPEECEIKNVGDVQFENNTSYEATVYIYAIGIQPEGNYGNPTNNPIVASIKVPSHGSANAYDLTTGVHFINTTTEMGLTPGQIKIKKCQTIKETLKLSN